MRDECAIRSARDKSRALRAPTVPTQERVVRDGGKMGRKRELFFGESRGRGGKRDAKKQVALDGRVKEEVVEEKSGGPDWGALHFGGGKVPRGEEGGIV